MNLYYQQVLRENGLVALYRLNEPASSTTATDSSPNALNGTYSSGASAPTLGQLGPVDDDISNFCAIFTGALEHVTVADNALLKPTTGLTLEALCFLSSVTGTQAVIGKQSCYQFGLSTTHPFFQIWTGSTNRDLTSSTTLGLGWHHLVGTWDGALMTIYVDSLQVAQQAQTGPLTNSATSLYIASYDGTNNFFSTAGAVSEAAIYNVPLSVAQINYHYRLVHSILLDPYRTNQLDPLSVPS